MKMPLQILLLLLFLGRPVLGGETSADSSHWVRLATVIDYVSRDAYYISVGSQDGLQASDIGQLQQRNGQFIAMEIAYLGSSRSSLHRSPEFAAVVGDSVYFRIPVEVSDDHPDVDSTQTIRDFRLESSAPRHGKSKDPKMRLKGFLALGQSRSAERGGSPDWSGQRYLLSRLSMDHIPGLPLSFRTRFRLRQRSSKNSESWTSRVPLFEFSTQRSAAAWQMKFGRLTGTMGTLNGLLAKVPRGIHQWQLWAGLGTHPENHRPDRDRRGMGVSWQFQIPVMRGLKLRHKLGLKSWQNRNRSDEETLWQELGLKGDWGTMRWKLQQFSEIELKRHERSAEESLLNQGRNHGRLSLAQGRMQGWLSWRQHRQPAVLTGTLLDSLTQPQKSGEVSLGSSWALNRFNKFQLEIALPRDRDSRKNVRSLRARFRSSALIFNFHGGLRYLLSTSDQSRQSQWTVDLDHSLGAQSSLALQTGQLNSDRSPDHPRSRWLVFVLQQKLPARFFVRLETERIWQKQAPANDRMLLELIYRWR